MFWLLVFPMLLLMAALAVWCLYLHRHLRELHDWVIGEAERTRALEVGARHSSRTWTA